MNFNGGKAAQVLLVLILLVAVLAFVQAGVQTVDAEQVPDLLQPYWGYIVQFFTATPVIAIAGFIRNILGYARNYWKSEYAENYDVEKLYATWCFYIGGITTILAFVPAPYDTVFAGIIVLLDFVTSEIRKMRSEPVPT